MKQRNGLTERVTGVAQDVQATLRRRQQRLRPRVRVYWADGEIRTVPNDSPEGEALLEAGAALVKQARGS